MERTRRNPSISGDAENRPDADVQMKQPQEEEQDDGSCLASTSQVLPRKVQTARPSLDRSLPSSSPGTPSPIESSSSKKQLLSPQHAPDPPVTKHTLSELDVTKIIHNPKLRHDINFDPDLHFRPNNEGDKGKKKQERSNSFWRMLRDQLTQFVVDRNDFYVQYGEGDDWCLPVLLRTIKSILETLVPQRDREFLEEGLNVELLMQQFHRGVLDLEKLAEWLSNVLKSHCAPMRDSEVNAMFTLVKDGNRDSDLEKLVRGLRDLLHVLENMKLDVANHQIRCLRPVLIQDTIHFEQRHFYKRINSQRFNVDEAKLWYKNAHQQYSSTPSRGFGDMSVLFEAMSQLILPSAGFENKRIPETFQHDYDRLLKLRADSLDAVNLDICMRLFNDLESVARYSFLGHLDFAHGDKASSRAMSSDFSLSRPLSGSRPSSFSFSNAGSDTSSGHSSMVMPSYLATEAHESKQKAKELYSALLALLYTAPPSSNQLARWQAITPSMATEIFRHLDAPSSMLPKIESKLMDSLSQVNSDLYRDTEQAFHQRLTDELSNKVSEYKGLSGVSLYTVVSEKRVVPGTNGMRDFYECLREGQDEGAVDDIAMRLAHVGILHWRVWADIAYTEE